MITKLSGSYSAIGAATNAASAVTVHLYHEGLLTRNWTVDGPSVTLSFGDGEMAVIEAAKDSMHDQGDEGRNPGNGYSGLKTDDGTLRIPRDHPAMGKGFLHQILPALAQAAPERVACPG